MNTELHHWLGAMIIIIVGTLILNWLGIIT
jgi:hypothetical protein